MRFTSRRSSRWSAGARRGRRRRPRARAVLPAAGRSGSRRSPTTRRSSRGSTTRAVGRSHGFNDTSRRSCTTISRRSRKKLDRVVSACTGHRSSSSPRRDSRRLRATSPFKDAAAAIVGWTHAESARRLELLGLATPVLERWRAEQEQAALEREKRAETDELRRVGGRRSSRLGRPRRPPLPGRGRPLRRPVPRCGRVALSRTGSAHSTERAWSAPTRGSTSPFAGNSSTAGRSGPCSIAWISSPSRGSARSCDTDGVPSLARSILEEHLVRGELVPGLRSASGSTRRLPRTPPGRWR